MTPIPTDLAEDYAVLLSVLDEVEDTGGTLPCRAVGLAASAAWLAQDEDEQRAAARACRECDALAACRWYVEAHPAEQGVLGGIVEAERRGRRGRPRRRTEAA
ncbi:hypothetical protein GCM10009809_08220 [Isoptericola hypogeus]|uniref:4Fe-4S Wbl-type domain-containing protein n=1 Tax=Isoptericola hypogeus TaxID=300179 RepID=A0ABN2IYS5_9MICO